MKTKEIEAVPCSFTPGNIKDLDFKVCLKLTNLDAFMSAFALNYDMHDREYISPFQILGDVEENVINDYFKKRKIEFEYTAFYWKRGEGVAMFDFEGFSYDEDSKTLFIEFSYLTTAS